jgi:hypothetical protein
VKYLILAFIVAVTGCSGDDGGGGDPPLFPANYAESYQQVRNCRGSIEHGPVRVRVLADPGALQPYMTRVGAFPVGSIVLKEEFDEEDLSCATPFQYTVMQKLEPGSSPDTLDWTWQTVDKKRKVVVEEVRRCWQCHSDCGKPPEGFDGTCTVP